MATLRWTGRGVLSEGGELVPHGGEFSVSKERADELLVRPDIEESDGSDDAADGFEALTGPAFSVTTSEAPQGEGHDQEPVAGSENPDEEE